MYRTRDHKANSAEKPALPVSCVARCAQYGGVRGFDAEVGDDGQDFEVCDRLGSDQIEVFVVRIFVVEDSTHSLHIGARHESQGDRGNIVVLSRVFAQHIGFAMEDIETTIEQWAEIGY